MNNYDAEQHPFDVFSNIEREYQYGKETMSITEGLPELRIRNRKVIKEAVYPTQYMTYTDEHC